MRKNDKYVDENLIYILENTTPYQRLLWLKKAFNFWKLIQNSNKNHGYTGNKKISQSDFEEKIKGS